MDLVPSKGLPYHSKSVKPEAPSFSKVSYRALVTPSPNHLKFSIVKALVIRTCLYGTRMRDYVMRQS